MFFLVLFLLISTVCSQDYYTAAVIDYSPHLISSPSELSITLNEFNNFCKIASQKGAQIIIFPEYGLLSQRGLNRDNILPYLEYIPDPKSSTQPIIPCGNIEFKNRTIMKTLSCIAKQNNIVVVADMGDIKPCTNSSSTNDCPSDGRFQFNTLVAFSETGELIARYHKYNLYNEHFFDPSPSVEISTFTTSFNVTFGMFICFDIMFEHPAYDLVLQKVQNFVYSTKWVNSNYLLAVQAQQSWSGQNKVNLLASNIGLSIKTSGSGIYSNGEILASTFNPTFNKSSRMLISQVPKIPKQQMTTIEMSLNIRAVVKESMIPISAIPPHDITIVTFVPELNQKKSIQILANNNNLTCEFSYSGARNHHFHTPTLGLLAFAGEIEGGHQVELCAVSLCNNSTKDSCLEYIFNSGIQIDSFSIKGSYKKDQHMIPIVNTSPPLKQLPKYESPSPIYSIKNLKKSFIG
ncbi:hypothetical protein CYY_010174, partial [Polysphondylium violaceum]